MVFCDDIVSLLALNLSYIIPPFSIFLLLYVVCYLFIVIYCTMCACYLYCYERDALYES